MADFRQDGIGLSRLNVPLERARRLAFWLRLRFAWSARIRALRSGLFDPDWYLATYPEVAAAGADPFSHYVSTGAAEGRDPGPQFSTLRYLQRYPDLARAGVNPLLHYLDFGMREGREIFPADTPTRDYHDWIARHERGRGTSRAEMRRRARKVPGQPLISIIMPTYNTPVALLRAAIDSVLAQIYENWQLCIADDASSDREVHELLAAYAEADQRIKVVYREERGGIALASNSALGLVTGKWVAMLDHDDLLAPHALLSVADAIKARPGTQLLYSDEDKITESGRRYGVYFKPDFSLELFRSQNYLNHLTVHRAENIRAVGGWRSGFDGSQDYDLNLRIVERLPASAIRHIPEVLYHWRVVAGSTALAPDEKRYAYTAGLRALNDHINRLKLPATVEQAPGVPYYRVRFALPRPAPFVSIVIPTRDKVELLRMSVGGILDKTSYEPFEILVIDNGSAEAEALDYLDELAETPRVRVLPYPHPFNYAAINNFGAREAKGDILALLNNDIEVVAADWLSEMVSYAAQDGIGCVGAKLYYPNRSIQHAGVILGIGGVAGHAHKHFPPHEAGHFGRLKVVQNFSAVTGACLVVRKSVYLEAGGLDEALTVAFNDVDFCLKVRDAGYRNVWTPYAELIHHESLSRGHEDTRARIRRFRGEIDFMKKKWSNALEADPFYSPHLTLEAEDFSIRKPKRSRSAKTGGTGGKVKR
jgi:glycosyltransferase involved in cell wall biosynthesis